ncbi:MAG: class I SAM-dependent methyltransferase [Atopobiaceae bacterium]|nr:class I SAM-dependent methyltransferase [Atopobiaceae bacterium]
MEKLHIENSTVQETLIIPLYGRKLASEKFPGLIADNKAAEIIDGLDYDFTDAAAGLKGRFAEFGVLEGAMRSYDLVCEIKTYLLRHPEAAVVNLGCGLDTLFTQADNGRTHGYNIDFPDVIELREQLVPPAEHETNIAADLNDTSWFDAIDFSAERGAIFVAAGVFYYFTNEQVRSLLDAMAAAFPAGRISFDATRKSGLKMMLKTFIAQAGISDVGAYFHVENPSNLESWSTHFARVSSKGFMTGYHPWDKSWGAGKHLLARLGDSTGLTRIISIDFAS